MSHFLCTITPSTNRRTYKQTRHFASTGNQISKLIEYFRAIWTTMEFHFYKKQNKTKNKHNPSPPIKKKKKKKNNPTKNGLSYSKWLSWLKIFQY